jgi:hypothetical protein
MADKNSPHEDEHCAEQSHHPRPASAGLQQYDRSTVRGDESRTVDHDARLGLTGLAWHLWAAGRHTQLKSTMT